MSDAIRRAIRTFVQGFIGALLSSGILSTIETNGVVDWSALKKVGISALIAGLIAFITYIQNALEDTGTMPAYLKAKASSGANPATVDPIYPNGDEYEDDFGSDVNDPPPHEHKWGEQGMTQMGAILLGVAIVIVVLLLAESLGWINISG